MKKETKNFTALIIGIILVIIGMSGTIITLPTQSKIIILPVLSIIIGAVLAITGGLGKW